MISLPFLLAFVGGVWLQKERQAALGQGLVMELKGEGVFLLPTFQAPHVQFH